MTATYLPLPLLSASVLLATALPLLACGGNRAEASAAPQAGAAAEAGIEVRNLGFPDMTIYAVTPAGSRVRLGIVTGNSTQRLTVPPHLLSGGGGRLRFLADPIGGDRTPVSEELFVAPGETVTLTIPPNSRR